MRIRKVIAAATILAMAQGCTVVRHELRSSGGYAGNLMDRRLFNAESSKRLQLLRMTMIIALASRIGTASIRDAREAEAFVSYLQNASEEVNFLAGHLYGQADRTACVGLTPPAPVPARVEQPAPAPPAVTTPVQPVTTPTTGAPGAARNQCDTYEALFESDLPQLEYKVVRLVLAALPQRQAGEFLRSARSGNFLGAAWHFLKLAAAAADGFHRGAATYRSSQEILAIAILSATNSQPLEHRDAVRCAGRPPAPDELRIRTVEDAVACLGLSPNDLFENPLEANVRFPRDFGPDPFHALYEIIRTSCGLLPIEVGLNSGTEPAKARREKCATLVFEPQLRFGGRSGWDAVRASTTASAAPAAGARQENGQPAQSERPKEE